MKVKKYQELSEDKYGVHQKVISWTPAGSRVLDLGCAAGYVGCELAKKGCSVTGIDINIHQTNSLKNSYKRIIAGNLENPVFLKNLKHEKFDCIIAADVLEHLKDPLNTLKQLVAKYLKPVSEMIISVPNAVFVTNRLLMLAGKFDYTDWGIMDRTHLRFFTKKSFWQLLRDSGLDVIKFDCVGNFTQLPLYLKVLYPVTQKFAGWSRWEWQISKMWPEGLAIQFLAKCKKR